MSTTRALAQRDALADYALDVGDEVTVALLVTVNDNHPEHRQHPHVVHGTVRAATGAVLVLASGRPIRVPWAAVAYIEGDLSSPRPDHPGLD